MCVTLSSFSSTIACLPADVDTTAGFNSLLCRKADVVSGHSAFVRMSSGGAPEEISLHEEGMGERGTMQVFFLVHCTRECQGVNRPAWNAHARYPPSACAATYPPNAPVPSLPATHIARDTAGL
jgi:hypothetical protein